MVCREGRGNVEGLALNVDMLGGDICCEFNKNCKLMCLDSKPWCITPKIASAKPRSPFIYLMRNHSCLTEIQSRVAPPQNEMEKYKYQKIASRRPRKHLALFRCPKSSHWHYQNTSPAIPSITNFFFTTIICRHRLANKCDLRPSRTHNSAKQG